MERKQLHKSYWLVDMPIVRSTFSRAIKLFCWETVGAKPLINGVGIKKEVFEA